MAILLPIFGLIIWIWFWIARRGSTLTRLCRWRLDRRAGEGHWHCISCGAECDLPKAKRPRHCLRKDDALRPQATTASLADKGRDA